jgi:hypothetical protein
MTAISRELATVLDNLPVSVGLFSRTGRVLGRAGGRNAGLLRDIAPSQDSYEATRWRFVDKTGAAIPRTQWASARALRGEHNDAGIVGSFWNREPHAVRVTCVPTFAPDSDVAFVSFLQFLNAPTRCAEGSHQDLQKRLIRELAAALASSWRPTLAN